MERSLLKPFIVMATLMVVSIVALAFTVDVELDFVPGVKLELPPTLEGWVGNEVRFCHNQKLCNKDYKDAAFYTSELELPDICPDCGERLFNMSRQEKEQLPDDTEFIKSAYTNDASDRVFASIVLSGVARDSIHRPQRCLKGQGNDLVAEYDLEVPIDGRDPLKVRIIKLERIYQTVDGPKGIYTYYAYWFVGQDRETPSHYERMFWLGWDRVIRSTAHRWAYIAVSGTRAEDNDDFEDQISDFVHHMYPFILTDSMREKFFEE